ncbi:hypothetical protein ABZ478_38725, partial [Streptomyces sp. NPDC005706]|uniref:hypothetical protein n=1 Tax=Streptomyces sp. NPDC005706 TaxID=3157169 RepID=UPI0033EC556D
SEKFFGHPTAGIYGYSHLTGGFAGGQAEYARLTGGRRPDKCIDAVGLKTSPAVRGRFPGQPERQRAHDPSSEPRTTSLRQPEEAGQRSGVTGSRSTRAGRGRLSAE